MLGGHIATKIIVEDRRFDCQPGCTNCCDKEGWVYLTDADVPRIAQFLGLSFGDFERQFVYRTKKRARLRVPKSSNCSFLEEGGCSIHEVKPTQCRTFPYWPELLDNRRKWHAAGAWCPGIGQGPLINIESANAQAEEMRVEYPFFYDAVEEI